MQLCCFSFVVVVCYHGYSVVALLLQLRCCRYVVGGAPEAWRNGLRITPGTVAVLTEQFISSVKRNKFSIHMIIPVKKKNRLWEILKYILRSRSIVDLRSYVLQYSLYSSGADWIAEYHLWTVYNTVYSTSLSCNNAVSLYTAWEGVLVIVISVESLQSHFILTMSHWSSGLPVCFLSQGTQVQIPWGDLCETGILLLVMSCYIPIVSVLFRKVWKKTCMYTLYRRVRIRLISKHFPTHRPQLSVCSADPVLHGGPATWQVWGSRHGELTKPNIYICSDICRHSFFYPSRNRSSPLTTKIFDILQVEIFRRDTSICSVCCVCWGGHHKRYSTVVAALFTPLGRALAVLCILRVLAIWKCFRCFSYKALSLQDGFVNTYRDIKLM